MIQFSVEQAWAIFIAGCSGLAMFAWLVWWLSGQFNSLRTTIADNQHRIDRRVLRLEIHAGFIRHWNAADEQNEHS